MKLRKLSVLAAVLLLLVVADLVPDFCFGQPEDSTATTEIESPSELKGFDRPVSFGTLAELGKFQTFSDSGSPSDAPRQRTTAGTPKRSKRELPKFGLGLKVSSLGAGVEAATAVTRRSNLRVGFNAFSYSRGFDKDGIRYIAQLSLRSVEAHYDWFPPFGRGFHLSPGLLAYNGNHVNANASVPGGQTFTLGGTTFMSDPADPIHGKGKLDVNKAAPTFLFGWGNLLPRGRRRFSFNVEAGVIFQGSPRVALNLNGSACDPSGFFCRNASTDPGIQSSVRAEEQKLNNNLSPFKFYPVISTGIGFKIL